MPHYKDPQNKIHFIEDAAFAGVLPEGSVEINDDEALQINEENQKAAFAALPYSDKRRAEYPPIGDQLDALWKGGEAAAQMLAAVQAVKAKYPKE